MIIPKITIKFRYMELKALKYAILEAYRQIIDVRRMGERELYQFFYVKAFYEKKLDPRIRKGEPAGGKEIQVTLDIPELYAVYHLLTDQEASLFNDALWSAIGKLDQAKINLPPIRAGEEEIF